MKVERSYVPEPLANLIISEKLFEIVHLLLWFLAWSIKYCYQNKNEPESHQAFISKNRGNSEKFNSDHKVLNTIDHESLKYWPDCMKKILFIPLICRKMQEIAAEFHSYLEEIYIERHGEMKNYL